MSNRTKIVIQAENRDAVNKLRETGRVQDQVLDSGVKKSNKLAGSLQGVATKVVAMAGAYIGFRAVMSEVNKMASEFIEKEDEYMKLGAAIEIVGESWTLLEQRMRSTLGELQRTTRFSDNEMARAMRTLTLLTGDVAISQENLTLSMDLASTGLWNLETAARYVAMALEGNYMMLQRYVPALRGLEEKLGASATEAEKLDYVMGVLRDKFGGLAQNQINSTAGAMQMLENQVNDLRAETGQFAAEISLAWQKTYMSVLKFVGGITGLRKEYVDTLADFKEATIKMTEDQLQQELAIYLKYQGTVIDNRIRAQEELNRARETGVIVLQNGMRVAAKDNREAVEKLEEQVEYWQGQLTLSTEHLAVIREILQNYKKQREEQESIAARQAEAHRARISHIREELRIKGLLADFEEYLAERHATRFDTENDLATFYKQRQRIMMTGEERITDDYKQRIEYAYKIGDYQTAIALEMLMREEIINEKLRQRGHIYGEINEKAKELTERQLFGAQLAADVLYEAMGGAFDNIERMFMNMIKRMIAEALILAFLMKMGMGGIPGFSSGKFLLGLLGGGGGIEGQQFGGDVRAGQPYVVGEAGRELFVPRTDGYVVPNNVTNNILETGRVENLLTRIENAIYGTALTDVAISRASEAGSLKRYDLR